MVRSDLRPSMGAEDFSYMLQVKPGCYVWLGNGLGEGGCMLHNPHYDFNDEILSIGASYWAKLAEHMLAR
jgi:hippurate hydrolase